MRALREWVSGMEKCLSSLQILTSWSPDKLQEKLHEHQVDCGAPGCLPSRVLEVSVFCVFYEIVWIVSEKSVDKFC